MDLIKFNCNGNSSSAYSCDKPGDNSGEYVKKEEVERMIELLKATYSLLKKCDEGPYVKNALGVIVAYDETDCDGYCLMNDIEYLIEDC